MQGPEGAQLAGPRGAWGRAHRGAPALVAAAAGTAGALVGHVAAEHLGVGALGVGALGVGALGDGALNALDAKAVEPRWLPWVLGQPVPRVALITLAAALAATLAGALALTGSTARGARRRRAVGPRGGHDSEGPLRGARPRTSRLHVAGFRAAGSRAAPCLGPRSRTALLLGAFAATCAARVMLASPEAPSTDVAPAGRSLAGRACPGPATTAGIARSVRAAPASGEGTEAWALTGQRGLVVVPTGSLAAGDTVAVAPTARRAARTRSTHRPLAPRTSSLRPRADELVRVPAAPGGRARDAADPGWVSRLRLGWVRACLEHPDPNCAGLLAALLLGDRSGLPPEVVDRFHAQYVAAVQRLFESHKHLHKHSRDLRLEIC